MNTRETRYKVWCKCAECGHEFADTLDELVLIQVGGCPACDAPYEVYEAAQLYGATHATEPGAPAEG